MKIHPQPTPKGDHLASIFVEGPPHAHLVWHPQTNEIWLWTNLGRVEINDDGSWDSYGGDCCEIAWSQDRWEQLLANPTEETLAPLLLQGVL